MLNVHLPAQVAVLDALIKPGYQYLGDNHMRCIALQRHKQCAEKALREMAGRGEGEGGRGGGGGGASGISEAVVLCIRGV